MKEKDITGLRFGRLIALRKVRTDYRTVTKAVPIWELKCDCGKVVEAPREYLGDKQSCGCLKLKRNGLLADKLNLRLYGIWRGMLKRCEDKTDTHWNAYGGRGITVCPQWHDYESFLHDLKPTYFTNGTLERIDNDGGYSPQNCKWIPRSEQAKNRQYCIRATYKGKTQTANEWARELNIPHAQLRNKLRRNISIEEVLRARSTP